MSIIKTKNNITYTNNNGGEFRKINDTGFKEGIQSIINMCREKNCIDLEKIFQDCLDNKYLTYGAATIFIKFMIELDKDLNLYIEDFYLGKIANGMNPFEAFESVDKELNSYRILLQIINKYFIVDITDGFIYITFTSDEEDVA
jgi:hypothetical protein